MPAQYVSEQQIAKDAPMAIRYLNRTKPKSEDLFDILGLTQYLPEPNEESDDVA